MKILALDTANNTASVCISDGEKILAYKEELTPSKQAETILPLIESVLKNTGQNYEDIDYLALTNGPGSFTGIRIGLAVAKGILFGTKIQGIVISNFEFSWFRAYEQIKNYDKIFILLNAYRDQLYVQVFDINGNKEMPVLLDYNSVIELISCSSGKIICAGSGVDLIYQKIKFLPHITTLPRFARIKALHICRYVASRLLSKQPLNTKIEPLYIRQADAKVKPYTDLSW